MTHAFELAGLGKAPFRLVAIERRVGPYPVLNKDGQHTGHYVGAPGQPVGSCAFCGTGIAECCVIRDAKGKTFIVGNICVYKTGDVGLVNKTKREVNRLKAERRHEREVERIKACREALEEEGIQEALNAQPHPMEWRAENGEKLLSWALWMMDNAGNSGRIRVCRIVEKIQKAQRTS